MIVERCAICDEDEGVAECPCCELRICIACLASALEFALKDKEAAA